MGAATDSIDVHLLGCRSDGIPSRIEYLASVASTNSLLRQQSVHQPHGAVVIAETQSAGRGRLNRKWESPPYRNLTFSILLKKYFTAPHPNEMVIVFAVSLVQSLSEACGIDLQVRWPNDIYGRGKKISGVLLEYLQSPGEEPCMIAGIGINVNSEIGDFSRSLHPIATSMKLLSGRSYDRTELLNNVLTSLDAELKNYTRSGLQPFLARWLAHTDCHNARLTIHTAEGSIAGTFAGLDPHGALQIRTDAGKIHNIVAGDARLVGAE